MRPESDLIQQTGHTTHESLISHPSVNPDPIEDKNASTSLGAVTEAYVFGQMQAGQVLPVVNFNHFNPQMGSSSFEGQGQQGQHQPLSQETRIALENAKGKSNSTLRNQ